MSLAVLLPMVPLVVTLFAFPLAWMILDAAAAERGKHARSRLLRAGTASDDFTVLVPIYGDVSYLRNLDYLHAYGPKVWLLTTTGETPEFDTALDTIATTHGFGVFRTAVARRGPDDTGAAGARRDGRRVRRARRATSGAMRDQLVRDALAHVRTEHVVCLDADTTTVRPLGELVAAIAANRLDFASVRLVPANTGTWLGKLQAYEYRVAMRLRVFAPWLVSGACHVGRTVAHREIMRHHSLFFQGNDVEAGILAQKLGFRVGHVPFDVPTDVPDTVGAWWRQRLAWAGGEVRLFLVNAHLITRHAWFWGYGLLVMLVGLPFRWMSITHLAWSLAVVYAAYLLLNVHLHRGHLNRWVVVLPLYAAFTSLVMTSFGLAWYVVMAVRDRNPGLIRLRPARSATT